MGSAARQSPGGCECGGSCSITLEFRNPCSSNVLVPTVGYTVQDGVGATVASGTTDASGVVVVAVPAAGTYTITPVKSGYFAGPYAIAVACGGVYSVPVASNAPLFTIRSCGFALAGAYGAGATIAISGPRPQTLTTGSGGTVRWAPMQTGAYTYTITHPSGRLAPFAGSITITSGNLCSASITANMLAATGYSCCFSSAANPLPFKRTLVATTSGGETFNVVDCGFLDCVPSDTVTQGGEYAATLCPPASYLYDLPGDHGSGKVATRVAISMGGGGVVATVGVPTLKITRPVTFDCANVNAYPRNGNKWFYNGLTCAETKASSSKTMPDGNFSGFTNFATTPTIVSAYPLVVTLAVAAPGSPGYSWYQPTAIPSTEPGQPVPMASITIVEP